MLTAYPAMCAYIYIIDRLGAAAARKRPYNFVWRASWLHNCS